MQRYHELQCESTHRQWNPFVERIVEQSFYSLISEWKQQTSAQHENWRKHATEEKETKAIQWNENFFLSYFLLFHAFSAMLIITVKDESKKTRNLFLWKNENRYRDCMDSIRYCCCIEYQHQTTYINIPI